MTAPERTLCPQQQPWIYRWEDLDPGFVTWFALAYDVCQDDREAGLAMLTGYVDKVLTKAHTPGRDDAL